MQYRLSTLQCGIVSIRSTAALRLARGKLGKTLAQFGDAGHTRAVDHPGRCQSHHSRGRSGSLRQRKFTALLVAANSLAAATGPPQLANWGKAGPVEIEGDGELRFRSSKRETHVP